LRSGLIALLDDVAAITKLAAASIDDAAALAAKAGIKAAGVVVDDAAMTPRYVLGFDATRELPIVGKIALGSPRNKLVLLAFLSGIVGLLHAIDLRGQTLVQCDDFRYEEVRY
jgi:predicted DNA repair protein MutK